MVLTMEGQDTILAPVEPLVAPPAPGQSVNDAHIPENIVAEVVALVENFMNGAAAAVQEQQHQNTNAQDAGAGPLNNTATTGEDAIVPQKARQKKKVGAKSLYYGVIWWVDRTTVQCPEKVP